MGPKDQGGYGKLILCSTTLAKRLIIENKLFFSLDRVYITGEKNQQFEIKTYQIFICLKVMSSLRKTDIFLK